MQKAIPTTVRHFTLEGFLMRLATCLYDWQARHCERQHLAGLDDRLLKDIGLTRTQVSEEVRKPFWRQ